jgi:hypothetical protein
VTRVSLDRFRIGPKRGFSAFRIAMSPRDKLAGVVDEIPRDPTLHVHRQNRRSRPWYRLGADSMTAAVDPLHE